MVLLREFISSRGSPNETTSSLPLLDDPLPPAVHLIITFLPKKFPGQYLAQSGSFALLLYTVGFLEQQQQHREDYCSRWQIDPIITGISCAWLEDVATAGRLQGVEADGSPDCCRDDSSIEEFVQPSIYVTCVCVHVF